MFVGRPLESTYITDVWQTFNILSFVTKPRHTLEAKNMRLKFERSWVHKLRTPLPYGLNGMD